MKRYFLSKIFKDVAGTYGIPGAWMHQLQTHPNVDYVGGEIAVDPQTGVPSERALLVLVGTINATALVADKDLVALPQVSHDLKVSAIHGPTKLKCKADMVKMGFTQAEIDDVWNGADGMRDVLEHFGRKNNPQFSCDNFDLNDA